MGVVVEEATSLEQVAGIYVTLARVYDHIRVPLAPPSLFQSAFKILHPRGMCKFLKACVNGICIGIAVRLFHKDTIYAWYAGMGREHASYKANDLLNWHILEWGAKNGFGRFDFGGAGKPDQDYGPRKFKAKFNGELVNYGRHTHIHHPYRLRLSIWGYKTFRQSILRSKR
jgi:lipid II:glycine glycyltransferase (peptidoglycan interpeptide bridge formation enzyme)